MQFSKELDVLESLLLNEKELKTMQPEIQIQRIKRLKELSYYLGRLEGEEYIRKKQEK